MISQNLPTADYRLYTPGQGKKVKVELEVVGSNMQGSTGSKGHSQLPNMQLTTTRVSVPGSAAVVPSGMTAVVLLNLVAAEAV